MSRCLKCNGTKKFRGMGMIFRDCDCTKEPVTIDKRSKAYREAIDKIMTANDCDRDEAVSVFESEFDKIA